ncbi:hypothetical protein L6452_33113 [Arctium lappa]|uniref:Uncharacterized protein n=1 Tax=Arctium lappa TaxID=4217 RepID=A0ACB8ZB56_ARCLA|nr:hypothetical protein L6452_33113 [Arctium lappa]
MAVLKLIALFLIFFVAFPDAHEDGDCAEGEALQHAGGTSTNDNIPSEVSAGGVVGEVESTPDLLTNIDEPFITFFTNHRNHSPSKYDNL